MTRSSEPRSRRQRIRWLVTRVGIAFAVLYVLGSVGGAWVLTHGARGAALAPATDISSTHEDVTFASRVDHITLSGWLFHAPHPTGRSVIFVHGWLTSRVDGAFVPIAHTLLDQGYDALLFDMRASGMSGGDHQTLANYEPRDVLGAYDFMRSRQYKPALMAVISNSMGASTVIEASPQLADVAALVCDSAYADLGQELNEEFTDFTYLPGFLNIPGINLMRMYGVDPQLKPIDVVRAHPERAYLFITVDNDPRVPAHHSRDLRAASANSQSELEVFHGNRHIGSYETDPNRYMTVLSDFINGQIQHAAGH